MVPAFAPGPRPLVKWTGWSSPDPQEIIHARRDAPLGLIRAVQNELYFGNTMKMPLLPLPAVRTDT